MKKMILAGSCLLMGIAFFHSCSKDKGPLPQNTTDCIPRRVVILVGDGGTFFSPASVDVKVGDIIVWKWASGYHNVIASTIPAGAVFNTKDPIASASDSLVNILQVSGTYDYECTYHTGMTGTINVCNCIATYSDSIAPILSAHCNSGGGCHEAGSVVGDYTTYPGVKAAADNGSLRQRVLVDMDMPPATKGTLSKSDRDKINCWINNGALNN